MRKSIVTGAAAAILLMGAAQAAPAEWKTYTDAKAGWSISYPANFVVNKDGETNGAPDGVKSTTFSVPESYGKGTNLNEASISVDTRPGKNCKPGQFVDPVEDVKTLKADGRTYIAATSSDAGMSQYYATSIFIVKGTCLAVRYFTHSTNRMVIDPPPKEFDDKKLTKLFDSVRATLVLKK